MDYDRECRERRQAELEFVTSAYGPDEAWCNSNDDDSSSKPPKNENNNNNEGEAGSARMRIHRRLDLELQIMDTTTGATEMKLLSIVVVLTLPERYPTHEALHVSAKICDSSSSSSSSVSSSSPNTKLAMNALPSLIEKCQHVAQENVGEESVFLVLNQAEEWIQDEWLSLVEKLRQRQQQSQNDKVNAASTTTSTTTCRWGRRMIWSHEMRSKIKGGDTKKVAEQFQITGYMKIGWPGLMLIEGMDDDCSAFFDEIRPRSCHPLVIRGTQQEDDEDVETSDTDINTWRKFDKFHIIEDNALMARQCKDAGLWELYCTGLKGLE